MKKIMVIGKTGCGKTSLCQCLNGENVNYKKTQSVEVVGSAIDTPGEYVESRNFYKALIVTSVDVDCIVFIQDCTDSQCSFSPGIGDMFNKPIIGVVNKIDLADKTMIKNAENILKLAGAKNIFYLSCYTKEGIETLKKSLI